MPVAWTSFAPATALLVASFRTVAVQPQSGASTQDELLARGRFLGEVVVSCGACHNTFGPGMQPVAGMALAGGRVFEERGMRAVAPNITQDRETDSGGLLPRLDDFVSRSTEQVFGTSLTEAQGDDRTRTNYILDRYTFIARA